MCHIVLQLSERFRQMMSSCCDSSQLRGQGTPPIPITPLTEQGIAEWRF